MAPVNERGAAGTTCPMTPRRLGNFGDQQWEISVIRSNIRGLTKARMQICPTRHNRGCNLVPQGR